MSGELFFKGVFFDKYGMRLSTYSKPTDIEEIKKHINKLEKKCLR